MKTKYVLIDIGCLDELVVFRSCTSGKVCGVYDTEEEAGQESTDLWDSSGRQQFHVLPIQVGDNWETDRN